MGGPFANADTMDGRGSVLHCGMLRSMMFVLVHSPVVGPSTWRWVAGALRSRGQDAVVPNLVSGALAGSPGEFARAAAQASDGGAIVVVGQA